MELCNNLGSEQREVPRFKPTATREFHDFDTKNPLKFNKKKMRKIRITQVI